MASKTSTLHSANQLVEHEIRERAAKVEEILNGNVLTYVGPINDGAQGLLKYAIEAIETKKRRLVVCLETYGGFIESAERIANTFRHHYRIVDFVITTFAMSAGTVLVMSGDDVFMDYSATLGPIDPQLPRGDGQMPVPALGYLRQFDQLIEKSKTGQLTSAEMAYLLQNFDPGELYRFEQARDLSIELLKEWLVKYKFKGWKTTETQHLKVTPLMKRERAEQIAKKLNDTDHWHSHSRGISMAVLRRDLKLRINDLDDNEELKDSLYAYHDLLQEYRFKVGHHLFSVDWVGGYVGG
jgi:Serine dehydrogenase proteinase